MTILNKKIDMAVTPSNMMPLGTKAPNFSLYDTASGKEIRLQDVRGEKGTVIIFMCNHCPFVIHIIDELLDVAHTYMSEGISFVGISSNDVDNYPQDNPDKMRDFAMRKDFPFPYLYDETQEVAKAYDAACTPDFFVFDSDLECVYRGQFDNSRPGNNEEVTGSDLRRALDAVCAGEGALNDQQPSIGCNIKWK